MFQLDINVTVSVNADGRVYNQTDRFDVTPYLLVILLTTDDVCSQLIHAVAGSPTNAQRL